MAHSMGISVKGTTAWLLLVTSLMVSATLSYCGLVGFVGLVIPHLLRRPASVHPKAVLDYNILEKVYGCPVLVDKSPLGDYPRVHLVTGKYIEAY